MLKIVSFQSFINISQYGKWLRIVKNDISRYFNVRHA